jgi:hypothetical protein
MVATLLERFNVIAGGDKMAQQLAPEIGTVPAGGMVSVDVEGRRLAVANVDGALFCLMTLAPTGTVHWRKVDCQERL